MILLDVTPSTPISPWITILTAVISSGAVAGIITSIGNRRMKKTEFEFDYKKYILKRRLEAYEKIEKIILELRYAQMANPEVFRVERDTPVHRFFDMGKNNENLLDTFIEYLANTNEYVFWLSNEMMDALRDLGYKLTTISLRIRSERLDNYGATKLGIVEFDSIMKIADRIEIIYFRDIQALDDIDSFKKNKLASKKG